MDLDFLDCLGRENPPVSELNKTNLYCKDIIERKKIVLKPRKYVSLLLLFYLFIYFIYEVDITLGLRIVFKPTSYLVIDSEKQQEKGKKKERQA